MLVRGPSHIHDQRRGLIERLKGAVVDNANDQQLDALATNCGTLT